MNITLSANERVIEKARAAAEARGLTLNDLVRRYMSELAGEVDRKAIAKEFAHLCLTRGGRSPEGWKFNREEAHKRGSWS